MPETMHQTAPDPVILRSLVEQLSYRPGWEFYLDDHWNRGQGSEGLTLFIHALVKDSNPPHDDMGVTHLMIVPAASYDERSWRRWLLEQILLVESHEACEFFRIDGERAYAPSHGHGNDPYMIREIGTDIDARTTFRNEVKSV